MNDSKSVHILHKNVGETPNEAVLRWKKENPKYADVPATYAGRLDPMAEGLLLVLTGDDLLNKDKYLNLSKTYIFEILWGFKSDTHDLLGLSEFKEGFPSESDLVENLKGSIGKFTQKYPIYSSKPVLGKPLFKWAREGKISEIEIPEHEVLLSNIKFIERREISGEALRKNIKEKIAKVLGDFRQKEILDNWQKLLEEKTFDKFTIDKIEVEVSSGFYVRQFVSDIAEALNLNGVTYSINRISIGS
jgi:tRNA pseudouridine(55) synthase